MATINQPTAEPTSKVQAAGIGGAISTVLIYIVETTLDISIPGAVAAAIAVIVAFGAAYITKEKA